MDKVPRLADYIKSLREAKFPDMKQSEFAKKADMNAAYISMIENGTQEPSIKILTKLANTLEVPLLLLVMVQNRKAIINLPKKLKMDAKALMNKLESSEIAFKFESSIKKE